MVLVEEVLDEEDVDVDVDVEDSWDDQGGVIVDQIPPRSHFQTHSQSLSTSNSTSVSVSTSEIMQLPPWISPPREPDPY